MTEESRDQRRARLSPAKRALLERRIKGASAPPPAAVSTRPPEETPRLAPEQRGLWTLHRLAPGDPAYHLVSAMRCDGELEADRLREALNLVALRHRILRSGWQPDGDEAVQVICESAEVPLLEKVAADCDREDIHAFAVTPFALDRPPLVRALLIADGNKPGWLVVVLPHLVSDEQGLKTFWRELAHAYDGKPWIDSPAQFDDVVWTRRREPDSREADLAFWRAELAEPFEPLSFATQSVEENRRSAGRLMVREMDQALAHSVAAFARSRGVTPFAVYLATYFAMLRAVTGLSHLAVGCPVSTRERPDEQGVIGYFLNAVVTSMSTDASASFTDAVKDLQARILRVLEHRRLPFDRLVEALQPPRARGSPPWFQTLFVMVEDIPRFRMGGAVLYPEVIDIGVAKFDLTWFIAAQADPPWIGAEYRTARHGEEDIGNLLERYARILRHFIDRPDQPMSRWDVLLPSESHRLFHGWQPDSLNLSGIPWVRDQIFRRCRDQPGAIALRCASHSWSYGELESCAHRMLAALLRHGVRAGDRVAILLDRSPDMVAAILGVHGAGAAYVPLDPAWPAARTQQVLEDAAAKAVITSAAHSAAYPDSIPAGALPEDSADPVPLTGDSPAYLIYTSGSTGRPKGVVVTQANLRASNEARFARYADSPEVFLLLSAFSFDSSVAGLFWTLSAGGTLVIPTAEAARDPAALRDLIDRLGITHLLGIPSLLRELMRNETNKMASLRTVIVAGEACTPEIVEMRRTAIPAARLVNEYGPTEATVWATAWEDDGRAADRIPIGQPAPHARIYVLDADRRPVVPGRAGICWIGGAGVSPGYWQNAERTAALFLADPFSAEPSARMYNSGDRVRWRIDGQLEFLGRTDGQIKVQGVRLETEEIESALRSVAGIRDAAALIYAPPGADGAGEGVLTGFLVVDAPPIDEDRLRRCLRKRLPEVALPSRFVVMDALPALPNGKTDRTALAQSVLPQTVAPVSGSSDRDRDPILQTVLAHWRKAMRRPELEWRDNVFEHGAHSMQVIQCAEALTQRHGIRVPVAVVFQHPVPYDLANWIRLHQTVDQPPAYNHIFPVHIEGNGAPLFAIQPDFTSGILTEALRGRRPVYGLRGIGLRPEGNTGRWPTLAALAGEIIKEIQAVQSEGPYHLSGYSLGAVIAIEVAYRMELKGLVVEHLVLFDPTPWNLVQCGPVRLQLRQCRRPVTEISAAHAILLWLRDNRPWAPFLWRRAGRVVFATPYRRILLRLARRRRHPGRPLSPRIMQADSDYERFRLFFGHRPNPISAPTLFFNARGPDYDAATLWRPFFIGPLDICPIDTVHQEVGATPATRAIVVGKLQDVLSP